MRHIFKFVSIVFIILPAFPLPLLAQRPTPARRSAPHPAARSTTIAEAVIAELLAMQPLAPEEEKSAPNADSKSENKPPTDNAPLKELIAYWSGRGGTKPSEIVQQRLLEAILNRPELLASLIYVLPESSTTYDQIYQLIQENSDDESYWKYTARLFLQTRSSYFREELLVNTRSDDFNERHRALIVLAQVDWEAAKPMIEQMIGSANPDAVASAWVVQYKYALGTDETQQAESILAKLKESVSTRQLSPSMRSIVLSNLMESEWQGQEEWFLSLFADPALSGIAPATIAAQNSNEQSVQVIGKNVVTREIGVGAAGRAVDAAAGAAGGVPYQLTEVPAQSLLANAIAGDSAKWIPKVIPLVGNADRNIHNSAVKFLIAINNNPEPADDKTLAANRKDAARALLPWLTNPSWASLTNRDAFVDSLRQIELPEAVPGLLTILDSDNNREVMDAAVRVLMEYKDPRAVGSLKRLLQKETAEDSRELIITALALCSGLSDEEMATTFEAYARKISSDAGAEEIDRAQSGEKMLPLNLSIGRVLYESDKIPAPEGLAVRLLARAKELRFKEPAVAQTILSGIQFAPLQVAQLNLLERISAGNVDADAISFALENRRDWQQSVSEAMYPLLKQGGYAAGIAATLLGESGRQTDILEGNDTKAQLALLATARHVRDKLPVTAVAPLLSNPLLTKAAESYLEIENSAAARNLIWARHPKQAWIVGENVLPDDVPATELGRGQITKKLQREVLSQNGKLEMYAILPKFAGSEGESEGIFVRVKGEEGEISLPNSKGYRQHRALTRTELQDLKKLTVRPQIEDLGPESFPAEDARGDAEGGPAYEYLRLSQENGRRIWLNQLRRAPKKDATEYEQLAGLFYTLSRTGEFKVRYDLEDKIRGLEVLYSNERQKILTVAQEGEDLRVLVSEDLTNVTRKRDNDLFPYEWRSFAAGQLGGIVAPPTALADFFALTKALLMTHPQLAGQNGLDNNLLPERGVLYWATPYGPAPGIWKLPIGGNPVKVRDGAYLGLAVTTDEKWIITTQIPPERNRTPALLRINLQTGEERQVSLPAGIQLWPHAYIPARQQVLLTTSVQSEQLPTAKAFLLDPATGKLQSVKGEFRPLLEKSSYLFQPTDRPDEVWAAIYDEDKKRTSVGRYNLAQFTFSAVWELPDFQAYRLEIWIKEGVLYFAHDGNLLRLALPKP